MGYLDFVSEDEYQQWRKRRGAERNIGRDVVPDPAWAAALQQMGRPAPVMPLVMPAPAPAPQPIPSEDELAAGLRQARAQQWPTTAPVLGPPLPMPEQPSQPSPLDSLGQAWQQFRGEHQIRPPTTPPVTTDTGAGIGDTVGQWNEQARQAVPGYAGMADLLGKAVGVADETWQLAPHAFGQLNPAHPQFNKIWNPPSTQEEQTAYWQQLKDETEQQGVTGLLPEGPVRGAVGGLGGALHSAITGGPKSTQPELRLSPEEREARWQELQHQQSDPFLETAYAFANPAYIIPPGALLKPVTETGRLLGRSVATAARSPVGQRAASTIEQAATNPALRRLVPGGTLEATAEAVPPTKRFYHGTGSTFESPDAAKFDPNGLYGPGYYLTDRPEVASSYAMARAKGHESALQRSYQATEKAGAAQARLERMQTDYGYAPTHPEVAQAKAEAQRLSAEADRLRTVYEQGKSGQQIRAVDVPENLRLLDAEAPVPKDLEWLTREAHVDSSEPLGKVYHALPKSSYVWNNPGAINEALRQAGYDGIRYNGGQIMPIRDAAGHPIEHQAVVIFPAALPKIKNALSGRPLGTPPEVGGAVLGGVAGGAQGETPEERAKNALLGAAGGVALGRGLRAAGRTIASGGQVGPFSAGLGIQPTQSTNAANAALGRMYAQAAGGVSKGVRERLGDAGRAFVRAATDRDVDPAQFQARTAKVAGRPLRDDELLYELKQHNSDLAAKVHMQEGLAPALKAAGEDRAWLSVYLTHQDNIDVARAMGQKVQAAATKAPLAGTAASDLARAQARLRNLQANYPYYASHPQRGPQMQAQIAASQQQIAALQAKLQRQQAAQTVRAQAAGAQAAAQRQFSGGLSVAGSQQALADMAQELGPQRFAAVQAAADQVTAFGRALLDRKVQAGLLTPQFRDELVNQYPHYVPTRITDYLKEPANVPVGKALSVRDTGLRRNTIAGTARAREDPLASMVRNAYETEALAQKNEAFNAFVKLRNLDPQAQAMIRAVPDSYTATAGEAKITGFVQGVRETYVVPKALEAVIKGEPGAVLPGFAGEVWGGVMSAFRMGTTGRNPLFLAGNATLDAATYMLRESVRAGGPQALPGIVADLVGAYADAFRGVLQGTYHGDTARFLKGGGGMFGFFQGTPGEARATVESLARPHVFAVQSAADLKRLAVDLVTLKPVEGLGARIELAPRVASFHRAERAGLGPVRAVSRGRTVTMDFVQGGNVAKVINQFVPFFNVGMQAPAQLVRAFRENPRGFVATTAALLAGPTVAAEAWNRSDPQRAKDYEDVPRYLKDQGIVIMLLGEAPVDRRGNRRPPFAYLRLREFAPFVVLTREVVARSVGDQPRDWWNLTNGMLGSVSPVQGSNPADTIASFTPLGVSTALQLATNQDYFRNRKIATEYGDERAAALSQAAGAALGVRPSQVEFTLRDLGGGVAGAALAASDLAIGELPEGGGLQDMPLVGGLARRFVRNDIGDRLEQLRRTPVSPAAQALLEQAGVSVAIGPVSNTIRNVPLTLAEQEEYQRRTNDYVDQSIKAVASTPSWGGYAAETREKLVRERAQAARSRAANEVLGRIGSEEVRQRLAAVRAAGP